MGNTIYQFRTFTPLPPTTDNSSPDLVDLYVYKPGLTSVGIKIRNPHETDKGNYTFKKVEVKQMLGEVDGMQQWSKVVWRLDEEFKLKVNKHDKFDKLLRENLSRIDNQTETLKKWLERDISQIVKVEKVKSKKQGSEEAILTVSVLGEEGKVWRFSSICQQNQDLDELKKKVKGGKNTSYPQLLQQLLKH